MLSELFLIDAEQLNGELQRFTQRERGATPASAASAADALADLLRTLELVAYASCVRALARWLDQVKTPAQIGERRELTNELIGRLSEVILSLRSDKPTADDKLFATDWLGRLAPAKPLAPIAPAVPISPADQADLPSALPPPKLPSKAPADALTVTAQHAAAADAERAAADQRSTALAQARSLHEGLAQTPASSRAGIERVIAGLVAQARVGCEQLGGMALPAALLAAPEALAALAAAVAALPAGHSLRATAAAAVISVEIERCQPSAYALAAVGQIIGQCGGRVDVLPDGLRLTVPRDPRRPMVVVLRCAQGWFALHSLQFEGLVGAAGVASDNKSGFAPTHLAAHSPTHVPAQPTGRISRPAAPARRLASLRIGADSLQLDLNIADATPEPSAAVWRYELPACALWPMPAQWQAMVSDSGGRLMPLLLPVEPKPMPAVDALPAPAVDALPAPVVDALPAPTEDVPALPLAAPKRKPRRRAAAAPVDPAQQAEPT